MAVDAKDFQFSQSEEEYADATIEKHNASESAHPDLRERLEECFSALGNTVQKVSGMGLSSNNYTNEEKESLKQAVMSIAGITVSLQNIGKELGNAVKKEEGKGLSSCDFTKQDKEHLQEAHRKAGSNEKAVEAHSGDGVRHVTSDERAAWDAASKQAQKASEDSDRVVNMKVIAETLDSGEPASVQKIDDGKTMSLLLGIPAGKTPKKGVDYFDGYTPVKGVDYLTQSEIISNQNKLANALKSTVSGNTITITDVSPLEHTAKCKVGGKNLLNAAKLESTASNNGFVDNGDGTYTFTKNGNKRFSGIVALQTPIPPNTKFVFSGTIVDNTLSRYLFYTLYDKDGKSIVNNGLTSLPRVISSNVEVHSIRLYVESVEPDGAYIKLRDLQIEVDSVATPFEQFIDPTTVTVTRYGVDEADNPQTFTPAPDGTVEIPSQSPIMTITSDTPGVNIECEYNRDINKAFAELQNAIISLGGNV